MIFCDFVYSLALFVKQINILNINNWPVSSTRNSGWYVPFLTPLEGFQRIFRVYDPPISNTFFILLTIFRPKTFLEPLIFFWVTQTCFWTQFFFEPKQYFLLPKLNLLNPKLFCTTWNKLFNSQTYLFEPSYFLLDPPNLFLDLQNLFWTLTFFWTPPPQKIVLGPYKNPHIFCFNSWLHWKTVLTFNIDVI